MDVHNQDRRSYNMSRIKHRDTKPELALRKALWRKGLRYRIVNQLPGKPDIVFPSREIAIFVDGCFWHRCPDHFTLPKTRTKFWDDKIAANVERDRQADRELREAGWFVLRFWEHEINNNLEKTVSEVIGMLHVPNE